LLLQGTTDIKLNGRVEVDAHLMAHSKSDAILEQVVGRLSLEPKVSAASWRVEPLMEWSTTSNLIRQASNAPGHLPLAAAVQSTRQGPRSAWCSSVVTKQCRF
jgi:hypothetical protein